MFLAKKLNKGAGSPVALDAQFNYVTMLLHGDGTNGAQNNTFLDSSTNNFTITRNGNTTQGSFSPYGSNWSNYFDGSGDYLSVPDNSALEGFTNFTFECWLYVSDFASGDIVFAKGFGPGFCPYMFYFTSTDLTFYASSSLTSWDIADAQIIVPNIVKNQWYHVAASRSGSSIKLFVNGAVTTSITSSLTIGTNTTTFNVASAVDGTRNPEIYISNLRINNTALYTAAFTPSTTPLTAISGTSLLTCQSNRFVDNSANNFAITVNGDTSVQRFNPFGASTAYSTGVIGGSGYFDGSGDYLKTSGTVGIANSAFTICCWFYPLNSSVIGLFDSGPGEAGVFRNYDVNLIEDQSGGTKVSIAGDYQVNAWNWLCITKSGTSFTVYINGTSAGSGTCASTMVENQFTIGAINNGGDGSYRGYISDFQVLNSATVVSAPTAPITNASGKTYLLNFQNGAIFDNAMMNDLETVGNAQISTSVVKYGTGSLAFDGTGDYLISRNYLSSTFGTGDFTIEMWLYYSSSASGSDFVIDCRPTSVNGAYPTIYIDSGIIYYYVDTANRITSSAISTNTWMHIAVCRSGTSTKMFINGTQTGSTYTDSTNYICRTDGPVIGADRNFGDSLLGYLDDLRITKGYARYTANFTPPTAAFLNIGPV